jgi:hypothetical protein
MISRQQELNQDIKKVGNRLSKTSNPETVEGLQKLFMILQAWKGVK